MSSINCCYKSILPRSAPQGSVNSCTSAKVFKIVMATFFTACTGVTIGGAIDSYQSDAQIGAGIGLFMGAVSLCSLGIVIKCVPLKTLEGIVNDLSKTVAIASHQNEAAAENGVAFQEQLHNLEANIKKEEAQNGVVQEQLNMARKEKEEIQKLLDKAIVINTELDAKVKQLQGCCDQLVTSIQSMDQDNQTLNALVTSIKSQIATLNQSSQNLGDKFDEENSQLAGTTLELSTLVTSITQDIAKRQKELAGFDEKISKLNSIDEEILRHTEALNEARENLMVIRGQIQKEEQMLQALTRKAQEYIWQLQSLGVNSAIVQ